MYRVRSDGSLKTQGEIRRLYPNTSLPKVWTPELLEELGLDPVFETPQPETTIYQIAFKDGVEQDAKGQWVWKWSVSEMDDEAKTAVDAEAAKNVRAERDSRLAETDWRFRSDMSPSQAWIDYCQALRDVPAQAGFPHNVTWPTKPE